MIDLSSMGLGELDAREMEMINGGEDEGGGFWYDAAYLLGKVTRGVVDFVTSPAPTCGYACGKGA
ncbi:MAG TPA: hypothetical protein VFH27_07745 [Longimicrobiaceae bacterium]|nr:hypothetical protein [Longimicrobiaceae bacterium]